MAKADLTVSRPARNILSKLTEKSKRNLQDKGKTGLTPALGDERADVAGRETGAEGNQD